MAGINTNQPPSSDLRILKIREADKFKFPTLCLDIYIEGVEAERHAFAKMFARTYSKLVEDPRDADLVIFTGGEDVDPVLYGERQHHTTYIDPSRDAVDLALFEICAEEGIPMLGICRGAQLLHVLNGGKLIQDIDGHNGGEHGMWDNRNNKYINRVSSVHHQSVIRGNPGMEVIAEVAISTSRWIKQNFMESGIHQDVEAFFYRDTCCLGIQGHPEYAGYEEFTMWCLGLVEEMIHMNPDISFNKQNVRRMLPDLVEQRKQFWVNDGKVIPSYSDALNDSVENIGVSVH